MSGVGKVLFQGVLQMRRLNSESVPGVNNAHVNLAGAARFPIASYCICQARACENLTRSTLTFKWIPPIYNKLLYCVPRLLFFIVEKHDCKNMTFIAFGIGETKIYLCIVGYVGLLLLFINL